MSTPHGWYDETSAKPGALRMQREAWASYIEGIAYECQQDDMSMRVARALADLARRIREAKP